MPGLTFHLIPHTHWDREWYASRALFVARLVPALDDLLDRLDASPAFRSFLLDGQTVLLEDYLRVRPERRERVAALARAGRLQLGPWYVLADEFVPSGESLIRNLLLGRSDAEGLGGSSEVLYSPDAFGHPAIWPALAAEFGLPYGVVWRGLGGEAGQDGDLYRWLAPDGRPVLLHHLPPDGYEVGAALPAEGGPLARAWSRLRPVLTARAATPHIAVPVGADHHASHPAPGRLRELLAGLEPGSEVRVSRLDEYFRAAAAAANGLPELRGELRWSYGYTWTLQGVHATRAPLKRRHADAELWLERLAEPLAALALVTGRGDARPVLREAWRALVRSQFHDSIGGCTSDAVARRVAARVEDAEQMAREVARVSLDALAGNEPDRAREHPERTQPRLVLWNPAARPREGAVVIADVSWFRRDVLIGPPGGRVPRSGAGARTFALQGPEGPIAVQLLGTARAPERMDASRHYPDQDEVDVVRVAFRAPRLGGFGAGALALSDPVAPPSPGVRSRGRGLENEQVSLAVGRDGSVSLRDRRTGLRYPRLLRVESSGDVGDTYSYAPPPRDGVRFMRGPLAVRVLAAGPLVGALELQGTLDLPTGRVGVRVVLALHAGSPAVRCTIELDNGAVDHRLRLRVATGLPGRDAVAGGPFGAVARSGVDPRPGRYPRETPVATAPAQRYVARAEGERGLAVLAPGFFEYELTRAGDLVVTLLRSVGELSRADLPTRPGHAGWPAPTPEAQCLGHDRLQLAICPASARELAAGDVLPARWEDCFLPPRARWLRQASPLTLAPVGLTLEGAGLVFSSLKPAEERDAVVVRCYNARAEPVDGVWRLSVPCARAARVRADEREPVELPLEDGGHTIRFRAGAREIVSLLLDRTTSR